MYRYTRHNVCGATLITGTERKIECVNREELEQSLVLDGWKLDGSFSGYLVIGYTDDLSLLVPEEAYQPNDLTFEIIDHERNTTYWVREIPTPQQAQQLLDEHGELPEEV